MGRPEVARAPAGRGGDPRTLSLLMSQLPPELTVSSVWGETRSSQFSQFSGLPTCPLGPPTSLHSPLGPPTSLHSPLGPTASCHSPLGRTLSDSHTMRLAEKTSLNHHHNNNNNNNNNSMNNNNHNTLSELCLTRRKLEPEDSSYDSDQEGLAASGRSLAQHGSLLYSSSVSSARSHEDVSRSDSETLGQEFAEYVTVRHKLGSRDSSPTTLAERLEAVQENPTTELQSQQQHQRSSSVNTTTTGDSSDITRITQDPAYNSKV